MRNFDGPAALVSYAMGHYAGFGIFAIALIVVGTVTWRRSRLLAGVCFGVAAVVLFAAVALVWISATCGPCP